MTTNHDESASPCEMQVTRKNAAEVAQWCGGKVMLGGVEVFVGMPMGMSHFLLVEYGRWIVKRSDGCGLYVRWDGEFGYHPGQVAA